MHESRSRAHLGAALRGPSMRFNAIPDSRRKAQVFHAAAYERAAASPMEASREDAQGARSACSNGSADVVLRLELSSPRSENRRHQLPIQPDAASRPLCGRTAECSNHDIFLHIWDRNMLEPTANAVSQFDLERLFYESVEYCQYGEVQNEVRFYKELPEQMQTQSELRRRIDKVLRWKEVTES